MIRGAIEIITPSEISGWLYGGDLSLRGQKVLAFYDQTCVGAGEVCEFRQDLVDAGLGDGFHGFRFPIIPPNKTQLGSIVVRLEGDDAVIIQKTSRVVGLFDLPETASRAGAGLNRAQSLQWMRGRGWLDQGQFDFLRYLDHWGIYDRMLSDVEQVDPEGVLKDALAAELLELFHMVEIVPKRSKIRTSGELVDVLAKVISIGTLEPVVALWSLSPARMRILDGSHREAGRLAAYPAIEEAPFTSYLLGPDRLLFFNARCQLQAPPSNQELTISFATLRE